jgi:hypothetical protein
VSAPGPRRHMGRAIGAPRSPLLLLVEQGFTAYVTPATNPPMQVSSNNSWMSLAMTSSPGVVPAKPQLGAGTLVPTTARGTLSVHGVVATPQLASFAPVSSRQFSISVFDNRHSVREEPRASRQFTDAQGEGHAGAEPPAFPGGAGFDARRRSFLPNMISSAERLARRRGIDGTRVRGIMLTCAAPRPWKAPPQ